MDIERLFKEAERLKAHFDAIDKDREECYQVARELRRMSVKSVRDAHKKEYGLARKQVEDGKELARLLVGKQQRFGFVEEALQEHAEAAFTLAFLLGEDPPTQEEIGTNERAFLLGLADTIGEMRRNALNLLRDDKIEEAKSFLDLMDDLMGILVRFDHTDAVLPLRRKQDQMRGVIERTRGDMTNIICQQRLEKALRESAPGDDKCSCQ